MKIFVAAVAACLVAGFSAVTPAQSLVVYPAKGQSDAKMEKDKAECYTWAVKESGYDPATAQQTAATTSGPKGERVKGGARGAAGGAAIGAIAGDAGKGAAIGATAGGMRGGMKARQEKREEQSEQQKAQAQRELNTSSYNKAYGACLEGRGYTVK
jgi:hypothetical protein